MYRDKAQRDFARTLRNGPTPAEKRLWHFLRAQKLSGYKFRRQAAIGSYIVDFICFQAKLIVEFDGPQHLEPAAVEYDKGRPSCRTQAARVNSNAESMELTLCEPIDLPQSPAPGRIQGFPGIGAKKRGHQ